MSTQTDFAATLVDEWVLAGISDAVLSPGSRSSPLAIALLAEPAIRVHVRLDERSAGFFALGCSLATARPTLVVTTSGTAAAELHAAVVEADLAGVPLVVCTADRPPELHLVGAPQTIEQQRLYGSAVRLYVEPGAPDETMRGTWRSLASRLVAASLAGPGGPGPVQCNLAFRDPLTGDRGVAVASRQARARRPAAREGARLEDRRPWTRVAGGAGVSREAVDSLLDAVMGVERGVIIAGAGAGGAGAGDAGAGDAGAGDAGAGDAGAGGAGAALPAVVALGAALGWPVLADPRAWPREPHEVVIAACDGIVRSDAGLSRLRPDLFLHLGAPHASKVLAGWCRASAGAGAEHVLVDPYGRFADPDRIASEVIVADPDELARAAVARLGRYGPGDERTGTAAAPDSWLSCWNRAERAAQSAIDKILSEDGEVTEPGVARELFSILPERSTLVVSSSMPVRDIEWYSRPRPSAPRVLANRGANGIDGVTSTVLGVASAIGNDAVFPVVGLIGDLAFLHDVSALVWGAAEKRPSAILVVIDNAGGGIFNFLPYATSLDEATFERGFGTPQVCDLAGVALAFGCSVVVVEQISELAGAIAAASSEGGLVVVLVRSERGANVALHDRLNAAIASAVDSALS